MVTGIETAGIILAVFPLIISALEHYKEGFETLQGWWVWRTDFLYFLRRIGIQHVLFRKSLQALLTPLVASEEQLNQLLGDPGGPAWRNEDLEDDIRNRLKSYDWYLVIMEDMKGDMDRLKSLLGIRDNQLPAAFSDSSRKFKDILAQELTGVKFVFNKKNRSRLLKRLQTHNDNLQQLLQSDERIAETTIRKYSRVPNSLRSVQKEASQLHRALMSAWGCACATHHSCNLGLGGMTWKTIQSSQGIKSREVNFTILFRHGQNASDWTWRESDIKILQTQTVPTEQPFGSSLTSTSTLTSVNTSLTTSLTTIRSRSIRFDVSEVEDLDEKDASLIEIQSLCDAIRESTGSLESIGLLRDGESQLYALHSAGEFAASYNHDDAIPLNDLLQSRDGMDEIMHLSLRQRIYVARILSLSVLQLHKTPWFDNSWDKATVLLLHNDENGGNPPVSSVYMLPNTETHHVIQRDSSKIIFALGVVLLELCFGKRLEEHPLWSEYLGHDGIPNDFTRLATASKWQEKAFEEAGDEYAEAIRKCLLCAFSTRSKNLDDAELREAFYNGVVKPVQDCWQFFEKGPLAVTY